MNEKTILKTIPKHWKNKLKSQLQSEGFKKLLLFLESESKKQKTIYPDEADIFSALKTTHLEDVKVVILGQDPYHGDGQAHGLSFSVNKGIKIPPSLRNIYKELETDIGIKPPSHGYLDSWAKQGVFLLNTVLTVEKSSAGSHRKKGWEPFTDSLIKLINDHCEHVVFLLWGAPAAKKLDLIDDNKHLVLTAPHPSPLSSYRGFFGCKHFSKANSYLKKHKRKIIDWSSVSD